MHFSYHFKHDVYCFCRVFWSSNYHKLVLRVSWGNVGGKVAEFFFDG